MASIIAPHLPPLIPTVPLVHAGGPAADSVIALRCLLVVPGPAVSCPDKPPVFETLVYDTDNSGTFNAGDIVIAGPNPAAGATLTNDPKIKFRDANNNNVWNSGEPIFYDTNSTPAGRVFLIGSPTISTTLIKPTAGGTCPTSCDPKVKFADTDGNGHLDGVVLIVARLENLGGLLPDGSQEEVDAIQIIYTYDTATLKVMRSAYPGGGTLPGQFDAFCILDAAACGNIKVGSYSFLADTYCVDSGGSPLDTVSPDETAGKVSTSTLCSQGPPRDTDVGLGCDPSVLTYSGVCPGDILTSFPNIGVPNGPLQNVDVVSVQFMVLASRVFSVNQVVEAPSVSGSKLTDIDGTSSFPVPAILVSTGNHPIASFTFTPVSPVSGQPVSFDASTSTDPESGPKGVLTYSWDFGDGSAPGSGVTPTHSYTCTTPTGCSFTVMLTVMDTNSFSDSTSKTITVTPAPSFNYRLSTSATETLAEGTTTSGITVTATLVSGTAEDVTLSITGLPAGVTASSFTPNPVTPTLAGAISAFDLTATSTAALGPVTVTITGTSVTTGVMKSATFQLTVTAPVFDYGLVVSPATVTLVQGTTSAASTVTATLSSGMAENVMLSIGSLPSGVTASTFSPNPVTPTGTGAASTFTLMATSSATTGGPVTVTVTGTSVTTSLVKTATFILTVVAPGFDFNLSVNPSSESTAPGGSTRATVTVGLVSGTATSVSLSTSVSPMESSITIGFSSGSVTPPGSSMMMVHTTAATPARDYRISVTGMGGGMTHTAFYTLTVTPAAFDYGLVVTPTSATAILASTAQTTTATVTATLTAGTTQSVTLSAAITGPTGGTGVSAVFAGAVTPTAPPGAGSSSMMTVTVQPTATPGTWTIMITGTPAGASASSATFTLTVSPAAPVFDYGLVVSPATVTLVQGTTSAASTVTATLSSGMAENVMLSIGSLPSGVTASTFSPNPVTPTGTGAASTFTLMATSSATTGGPVTVTVTGTSVTTGLVKTATFILTVVAPGFDFGLSITPTSGSTTPGRTTMATVTVTPVSGTPTPVSLSSSVSPSEPTITVDFSPSSVTPSGTSTMMVHTTSATPAGDYMITITGMDGGVTHRANYTLTVAPSLHTTTTILTCTSSSVLVNTATTCSATVTDNGSSPTMPSGTVDFSSDSSSSFTGSPCTLSDSGASASCPVSYTPTSLGSGTHTITARYSGDPTHSTSSGAFRLTVTSPPSGEVDLTFQAFDCDDFQHGVGQLDVLINDQLVVNIPAGLNHLHGTGDYAPYDGTWVSFGPFHVTSLVTPGTNTLVFRNPLRTHDCQVRNVRIARGSIVILNDVQVHDVSPENTVTLNFSLSPLALASFTASPSTAMEDEDVTFTATYSGGTGPFNCRFVFGDRESETVTSTTQSCSVDHDYDSPGTFTATIRVEGVSTVDRAFGSILVKVLDEDAAPGATPIVASLSQSLVLGPASTLIANESLAPWT